MSALTIEGERTTQTDDIDFSSRQTLGGITFAPQGLSSNTVIIVIVVAVAAAFFLSNKSK